MPPLHSLLPYGTAVLLVAVAGLAHQALDVALGDQLPYVAFLLAVALTAWVAGSGPALLATLLGFVVAAAFFAPAPRGAALLDPLNLLGSLAYLAVGLGIVGLRWLGERAERALRASQERSRSLLVASAQAVRTADSAGLVLEDSPSWRAFTGQSRDEAQGSGWLDALHHEDRKGVAEAWAAAIRSRSPFEIQYRVRRPDGREAWTLQRAAPVASADGRVGEWIVTNADISERKRAEQAEPLLAAIVESSDDAIVGKTLDGIVMSWNRGAERIFGYTAEEMIGQPIARLAPPDRVDDLPKILGAIRRGERVEHFETERIRKDGQRIHVSLSVSPIVDAQGRILGASKIARDVTERKRAEALGREIEEQIRSLHDFNSSILRSMGEGLYTLDADGCVTSLNPAAERLFGWSREELLGRSMHDATHHRHPDGTAFPAEECPGLQGLKEGKSVSDQEDFFIRKDGTCFPVVYSSSPLFSAGRITGLAVVFRDVTQQRRAEAEREELLAATERARAEAEAANRAKDEFLSVVSHELRTPLASMLNWLHVLSSGKKGPHQERALASLRRSAEAQSRLVEDLLDSSRIVSGNLRLELQPVRLADAVRAALDTVLPAAEAKGVRAEVAVHDGGLIVAGDRVRLQQIAGNLLSNAVKFTPRGGLIRVSIERTERDEVRLLVRDTGQGIAPAFLPHVFERFQQSERAATRREGGLGLGLAIVRHLVELHGGRVGVESEGEGRGATFSVMLPLSRHAIDRESPDSDCVLVVEDDPDVRESLAALLEAEGHRVRQAENGEEALQVLRSGGARLILLDLFMPVMNGWAFLSERGRDPELAGIPVVVITADTAAARTATERGIATLTKPVDHERLLELLARQA